MNWTNAYYSQGLTLNMNITKYMLLPKEITAFEHRYLIKLNKTALIALFIHIPVIMTIAAVSGTGVGLAFLLTALIVAGPTAAYFTLTNPRAISVVFGMAAMLIGGALVHFGQGPAQVEMHFYFFAMLAMLCMFANPAVNIAAAATAAVHHALVWYFLPSSFVNYDAQWWIVAIHAAFVVLETVAACYISRQFFDNVIGLEKIVEARTATINEQQRHMKLILDNVGEGLITINLDGKVSGKGSKALIDWFGEPESDQLLSEWIGKADAKYGEWFDLALESVTDGMLPQEVAISQLPSTISQDDRIYTVSYSLIKQEDEALPTDTEDKREFPRNTRQALEEKMLVVIDDVTEALEIEAQGRRQTELLTLFQHINRDKPAFLEFLSEAEQLITTLMESKYGDMDHLKRLVHTLKGNSAIFGMVTFSGICHNLESKIDEEGLEPSTSEIEGLHKAWTEVRKDLRELLGEQSVTGIQIEDSDYSAILKAVADGEDHNKVRCMIESWQLEPASRRLLMVQKQLQGLAERMGKNNLNIVLESNDLRMDSEYFAPFWSAFIHVLRNTVDHGVEDAESRNESGKAPESTIVVKTHTANGAFVISVEDDGPGVSWDRLRAKAIASGISVDEIKDDSELMFLSGISSKTEVSELSGRGVGMAAVAEACEALGGTISVDSESGKGTSIRFSFPKTEKIYEGHNALLNVSKVA
jgi:two-component system chemotaxis sensor kinase CheA